MAPNFFGNFWQFCTSHVVPDQSSNVLHISASVLIDFLAILHEYKRRHCSDLEKNKKTKNCIFGPIVFLGRL